MLCFNILFIYVLYPPVLFFVGKCNCIHAYMVLSVCRITCIIVINDWSYLLHYTFQGDVSFHENGDRPGKITFFQYRS